MTVALLDRLTHHSQIFEMNGESYRFRASMKTQLGRKPEEDAAAALAPSGYFEDLGGPILRAQFHKGRSRAKKISVLSNSGGRKRLFRGR
jgi:IstB-like ATP binding protein